MYQNLIQILQNIIQSKKEIMIPLFNQSNNSFEHDDDDIIIDKDEYHDNDSLVDQDEYTNKPFDNIISRKLVITFKSQSWTIKSP